MVTTRRELLRGIAVATVAGSVGLAGCTNGPPGGQTGVCVPTEPDYKGWFEGVSNYDCTEDHRGESEVRVTVGAKNANGYYAYSPAAVAVSPGTTVVWEWTGKGGTHDVVSEFGTFDSGKLVDKAGHTYTFTFDSPGTFRYYCRPHRTLGMKGTVFVALDDASA